MNPTEAAIIDRLNALGADEIKIRRQIGILENEISELKKELREIQHEKFDIRSTREYEEIYK